MNDSIQRREFLRRLGIAGAMMTYPLGIARPVAAVELPSLLPEGEENDILTNPEELAGVFSHGIASGDPLANSIILWTRVTSPAHRQGKKAGVSWFISTDPQFSEGTIVAEGVFTTDAERDWTVKVEVNGLQPYTYYYYAFAAMGASSPIGRTKTAPAGDKGNAHLRYGVVSCACMTAGFFNAYTNLANREDLDDLDAILHLGDYIYEYGDGEDRYGPDELRGIRVHKPAHEQVTLADYRERHACYKEDRELQRLHQLFPFVTTSDDHESTDNAWRDGAYNHNEGEGEWPERKAASQQAYDEWMPIRVNDPAIIYRNLPWGELIDLVMLDTRLEGRDEQLKYPVGEEEALGGLILNPEADDENRHLISETQMNWLKDRLSNSTAKWKILMQQVVVAQWNAGALPLAPEGALDAPQLIRDGGNALNPDAWDGYTADRNRLFDHLESGGPDNSQIDGFIVLTGDVHSSWAFDLTRDPMNPAVYNPLTGDGALGVEFVAPAVTSPTLGQTFQMDPVSDAGEVAMRANNPQLKWVNLYEHGYVILDVTPDGVQADWYFLDTVLAPGSTESLAASWRVNSGSRNLVQAQAPSGPKSEFPGPGARPSAESE